MCLWTRLRNHTYVIIHTYMHSCVHGRTLLEQRPSASTLLSPQREQYADTCIRAGRGPFGQLDSREFRHVRSLLLVHRMTRLEPRGMHMAHYCL